MLFAGVSGIGSSPFWIESDVASLFIAGLFVLAGLVLGYFLRSLVGRWQADSIEKKMRFQAEQAEAELKARRQEGDVAARTEVLKAREAFERSVQGRRAELAEAENRLSEREKGMDNRALQLDARDATLRAKVVACERDQVALAEKIAAADATLQRLARMTHLDARKELLARTNAHLREDAESLSRRIQEAAREQGDGIARNIILQAIQRCATTHVAETMTCSVIVPNAEMKGRIVGRDGRNARSFEAATGVTLLLDDAPDAVVISSFEPARRDIARRALGALVADGRIHPAAIEEAVRTATAEVNAFKRKAAEAAAAEANVTGLSDAVATAMGELAYRTSFTQNVLRHSVEVALLSGAIAAEVGLDAELARRIGFLHDIGKSATGSRHGAHAQIGADLLKTCGESETVVRAVAAHHGEGDVDGGPYGIVCAAADAISAARPGARQETLGDYVQRLEKVEAAARRHAGVQNVFAVQAGRDLRVMVDPNQVSDAKAHELAQEICREISAENRFPGQIRVTVIREMRCVEYAS